MTELELRLGDGRPAFRILETINDGIEDAPEAVSPFTDLGRRVTECRRGLTA